MNGKYVKTHKFLWFWMQHHHTSQDDGQSLKMSLTCELSFLDLMSTIPQTEMTPINHNICLRETSLMMEQT